MCGYQLLVFSSHFTRQVNYKFGFAFFMLPLRGFTLIFKAE